MNNCKNCGAPLLDGAPFCGSCGTPVNNNTNVDPNMVQNVPNNNVAPVPNGVPPKKNNKFLLIVIALVLVILIGVGVVVGKNLLEDNSNTETSEKKSSKDKEKDKDKDKDKDEDDDEDKDDDKDKDKDDDKDSDKDKDDDDDEEYKHPKLDTSNIKTIQDNDLAKNIEFVDAFYVEEYNNLYVLVKNNGTDPLNLTADLNYLNKSGTRVDRSSDYLKINPGTYAVIELWNRTKEDFDSYTVSVKADKYPSYYKVVEVGESDLSIAEKDTSMDITYTNKTDKDVTIELAVLFYKDGKVKYFDSAYISCKKGLSDTGSVYYYKIDGFEYGKSKITDFFDEYKIYVASSYSYDSDY